MLDGKVAVVTGGGRGIGRAIALRYAREGAHVVVSSRTKADLDAVVAEAERWGGRGLAVVADASDQDSAREPVRAAVRELGTVDIVVNNVGGSVGTHHDPFAYDDESFLGTLTLNLVSAWWTTQEALPVMREKRWGRIVNIGSGAAKRTGGNLAYTTAKHGLVGLTKQLAAAVAELGITVNCLTPGWTNTGLIDWDRIAKARGTDHAGAVAWASRECLQNRVLEPDELGGMAALLASEDGKGITGQVVSVDGGYKV